MPSGVKVPIKGEFYNITSSKLRPALVAGFLAGLAVSTPAQALKIELNNLNNVTPGTDAYKGFSLAAKFWETVIANDVTVKLNVGFSALGPGILGSTGSTTNVAYVGQVMSALQASKAGNLDSVALANLPNTRASGFISGQAIDALISAPKATGFGVNTTPLTRVLDANASANNSAFSANTSLMKALGLGVTYTGANAAIQADGTVQFSNAFNFDFTPENGIDSNAIDFLGVAIHEIGHALGFRSGVDTYDGNTGFGGSLEGFALFTVWDMFRYSAQSTALGVNDKAGGGTIATGNAPYFSIDGGTTIFWGIEGATYMSTGRNFGDARQASHWKDNTPGNPALGLLDPTVSFGTQTVIPGLDLAAFDAMGWRLNYDVLTSLDREFSTRSIPFLSTVPEPSNWAMLIAGFGLTGAAMRRRKITVAA